MALSDKVQGPAGKAIDWIKSHKAVAISAVSVLAIVLTLAVVVALRGSGSLRSSGSENADPSESPGVIAYATNAPDIGKGRKEPVIPEKVIPEPEPELPTGVLVMIDNYEPARPQSGIDKADVVYELIAEGGITRYMALFYSEAAPVIGPVRSSRYYFVQLAKGMDLPYAHVGGSTDALTMIGNLRIKDINEISNAAKYFWQDSSRKRPHATYTSTDLLLEAIDNKQYAYKAPDLPPIGKEFIGAPLAGGQATLTYTPGRGGYEVEWIWEPDSGDTGRYRRYINGTAQSTREGDPLVADTIYILAAQSRPRNTDPLTSALEIVGEGDAMCIVDNVVIKGTWKKESPERPLTLSDTAGNPMTRKPGKIWVQVVDSMENVSFG